MAFNLASVCVLGYDVSRLTRKATYTGRRPLLNSGVILKDFSPKDLGTRQKGCSCRRGCQTGRYQALPIV
jgi:hypothetical protein